MSKDDFFEKFGSFLNKSKKAIVDKFNLEIVDLIRAIEDNDVEEVQRSLTAGVNPNQMDGIERLALPIAVDGQNPLIVKMLLAAGADPNTVEKETGEPSLLKAVYWENKDIVKLLLEAGADINKASRLGMTPIDLANNRGYDDMTALLMGVKTERKAKKVAVDKAKHEAQKAKAEKMREEREAEKAKLEEKVRQKEQEIEVKKEKEAVKAAQTIEQRYGAEGTDYVKALLTAIDRKDNEAVRIFMSKIEDINTYNEELKVTPLMAAIAKGYTKLAKVLIDKGANSLAVVPALQRSPLIKAVMMENHELVNYMLEKNGVDEVEQALNNPDQMLSAQFLAYKDPKMLDMLLGAGADPFFGGKEGASPVVKAIEKASVAALPVLVKNKANLDTMTSGKTPIEWAIHFNREDWVNGLVEEEVNFDAAAEDGRTPLMMAVEANSASIVKLLIAEGADVTLKNKDGKTALEIAEALGDRAELVDLLK